MAEPEKEDLFHQCAWCGNPILEHEDYFGFTAKANPNIDLSDKSGQFVSLKLSLLDKTIFALVPDESIARGLGRHDLLFITCSEDCASNLKDALDLERDVFSDP